MVWGRHQRRDKNHFSVVGNSPEMCRSPDSFGLADLKVTVNFSAALPSIRKRDDPRRFNMNMAPAAGRFAASEGMGMGMGGAPTSERICEDIEAEGLSSPI